MSTRRFVLLIALCPLLIAAACYAARPCYPVSDAAAHAGKEICLTAHVYDVIDAPSGDRYLDVCPAEETAGGCRFTVLSLAANQSSVGALTAVEGHDIQLRGTVHSSEAGTFMLLSDARQLHGGAEKFRANPELMAGFGAGSHATAFKDPAMQGHHSRASSLFHGTEK